MPLIFSLVCVWIYGWVNNREAAVLRGCRAQYDVIVIYNKMPHEQYIAEGVPTKLLDRILIDLESSIVSHMALVMHYSCVELTLIYLSADNPIYKGNQISSRHKISSVVFRQITTATWDPFLLKWITFNHSMDQWLWSVGWHYLTILKLRRYNWWSFGVDG